MSRRRGHAGASPVVRRWVAARALCRRPPRGTPSVGDGQHLPLLRTARTVGLIIERIRMAAVAGESQGEERRFAGLGHDWRTGQIGGPTAEIPQIFSEDMGQEAPTPDRLARGLREQGDKTQIGMPAREPLT